MEHIEIVEVSPRDGLQNEPVSLPTADKVHLIEAAVEAGISRVEAASFVSPKMVPQMADAEDVVSQLSDNARSKAIGLVLNRKGLERALSTGLSEINIVTSATDGFALHNQNATREELIEQALTLVAEAHEHALKTTVTISAAFGCPYEGNVSLDDVMETALAVALSSPEELAFADTIGAAVPAQIKELIAAAGERFDIKRIRLHLHDTRGTGLANAWAGIEAGVRTFDASIGGLGGCPFAPGAAGNLATEDLVWLAERSGLHTGISLEKCLQTANYISERLGRHPSSRLSQAGPFPPR